MKKRILLVLLIGVMLLSLLAMTFASCGDDEEPETPPDTPSDQTPGGTVTVPGVTPDYPAPPVEEGAEDIGGGQGSGEKMEAPVGGGAVEIYYQTVVTIDLSEKKVSLDFRNPQKSLENMALQLIVQDQVLAESGLLVPGKRITHLDLKENVSIPVGYYETNAKFLIRYYDPETNACAILNTEIAVKVTVQE